jgi:hypothetical protein
MLRLAIGNIIGGNFNKFVIVKQAQLKSKDSFEKDSDRISRSTNSRCIVVDLSLSNSSKEGLINMNL